MFVAFYGSIYIIYIILRRVEVSGDSQNLQLK